MAHIHTSATFIPPRYPGVSTEVSEVYHALTEELYSIRTTLTLIRQLYSGDEETVRLLNLAAGAAFAHLKSVLFRDLLLGLARLCDPAEGSTPKNKKPTRENCTFERLIRIIEKEGRGDLASRLNKRLGKVINKRSGSFRTIRNKRLGHNDYITKMNEIKGGDSMPPVTLSQAGKLIRSMRLFLASVAKAYGIERTDDRRFDSYKGALFGSDVAIEGRDFHHLIEVLKKTEIPEPPMPHECL